MTGVFGAGKGCRLIIGAHYDSFEDTPGADDNASGVAGLLELARLFGIHPPDREIELVAFATEEPPFFRTQQMGSYIHAKNLADSGIELTGVLILEMIGYFTDAPKSQRLSFAGYEPGLSDTRKLHCRGRESVADILYTPGEIPNERGDVGAGLVAVRTRSASRSRFFGSPELLEIWFSGGDDHQHRVLPASRLSWIG